jgi:hypothetical protein
LLWGIIIWVMGLDEALEWLRYMIVSLVRD